MDGCESNAEESRTFKAASHCKEMFHNKNIPHAVVMREYGTSRCLNQLTSEFRLAAEEKLIRKQHKEMKCELPDFTRSTYLMVFSPDGKKMASSHGNHNVYVTDVKTGKNLNTLSGHPRTPWCIAFHPSSNQILASGCLGGQVRVWDLHGGSEIWTVEGQTSIASLAFHPSDRLLVIASYNEISFWDWSQPEPFARCSTLNEKEKIRYVAFDYTGSKLITGIEIPKPILSQWDRVGPGGQTNRPTGPSVSRLAGQRPGYGPIFSRPNQAPGSRSGTPSTLPGPAISTFNALHRASASQLEGRIRQNVQLLHLLLDARRNAQHELNLSLSRQPVINERNRTSSYVIESSHTSSGANGLSNQSDATQEVRDVINPGLHDPTPNIDVSSEFSQERARSDQQRTLNNSASSSHEHEGISVLRTDRINEPRATVNRSERASALSQPTLTSMTRGRSQSTEHLIDSSSGTSLDRGNFHQHRGFSNLGITPVFQNENLIRSTILSSETSRTSTQAVSSSRVTSQFNSLSEEIRQTLITLSENVDVMQHCSVCLPRMNSSRLSHIQQLWAELRDQIRSLQSSIWENTTLASNAWHRSSFEAITEMLSRMTHGDGDRPSGESGDDSNTSGNRPNSLQTDSLHTTNSSQSTSGFAPNTSFNEGSLFRGMPTSGSLGQSSCISGSNSQTVPFSTYRSETSSASTSSDLFAVNGTSNNSNSSVLRTPSRLNLRGTLNRSGYRPNQTRRLLNLRHQNSLVRRLGTTAGALRASRTSCRSIQQSLTNCSPDNAESNQQSSQPFSVGQLFVRERELPSESVHAGHPEVAISPENESDLELRETSLERVEQAQTGASNTSTLSASNNSVENVATENGNNSSPQCQLYKYRFFLGRRRLVNSRPTQNTGGRGSARLQCQRAVPPRFFGGRHSMFEMALGSSTNSQEQITRNTRTSNQPAVRAPDNMLMRIFRSLRRAATLSGHSATQPSNQPQTSETLNQPQVVRTFDQARDEPRRNLQAASNQQIRVARPQRSIGDLSSGLRLWTQYSGPEGDVLHIRLPQMERMDSVVQERLLRMRSSGTMNVVQDGVMTEELARNLLRLHLHQQHQELQLRQHQARLRVRFHHQNTLRNSAQAHRDSSRRLARCSLCGGSVYISSHFFVRLGTSSDPQPAPTSAQSSPIWRRWASPPPNTPPARAPPHSPSLRRQETQQPENSSEQPSPPASSVPPAPIPAPHETVLPQSSPTSNSLSPSSPQPAHPPLHPPLMRSTCLFLPQPTTQVLSPPQLFGGSSSPPSFSPPSPSALSPPPHSPPPPPPQPPPLVSQVSTQTNPRYFGGDSPSNSLGYINNRFEYTNSNSLLWQVPASHSRTHSSQQATGPHINGTSRSLQSGLHSQQGSEAPQRVEVRVISEEARSVTCPQNFPLETNQSAVHVQAQFNDFSSTDMPSTSSGIGARCEPVKKKYDKWNKLLKPDNSLSSTSSDSDSTVSRTQTSSNNDARGCFQCNKKFQLKENESNETLCELCRTSENRMNENERRTNLDSHLALPECSATKNSNRPSTSARRNSLKRKSKDSYKGKSVKVAIVYSSSSDSDDATVDSQNKCTHNRKERTGKHRSAKEAKTCLKAPQNHPLNNCELGTGAESSSQPTQGCEQNTPRQEAPSLTQLPEPTFTRQLEAITGRLDHLMFLQRNALGTAQRSRNGNPQDNSPLRNTGDSANAAQESNGNGSSDAVTITSRLLTRLTESLSRQIQMVQLVREQPNSCNEHQESPPRTGLLNVGVQTNFSMINNTRRRGQELLRLMADSLSTFSSNDGLPNDFQSNPAFEHVQTMSAAFWLLQGLYILLHLGLELTDLLLSHYISSYEPSDPEESSVPQTSQPCVCLNSNVLSSPPLLSRQSAGSSHTSSRPVEQSGTSDSRTSSTVAAIEIQHAETRPPRNTFSINADGSPLANGVPSFSRMSSIRRPWLVNLHNVLASVRSPIRPPQNLETYLRSRRNLQSESPSSVQVPVLSVPSYTPQLGVEPVAEGREWQTTSTSFPLAHSVIPSGTIQRTLPSAPHASVQQNLHQSESVNHGTIGSVFTRQGSVPLRPRTQHPSMARQPQDRTLFASDADMAAQQSLFFHFDYTRNIGHFVREPNFTTEEHRIHRIQLWDFSEGAIPDITNSGENLVVAECKIHNDASVDISADGHLLVALLPAPRPTGHPPLPSAPAGQTVGVYSLVRESLGQLLYTTSLEQPAVSVALSPTAAYLLVGLATRRTMLMPNDQHALAQIFRLEGAKLGRPIGARGRLNSYRYIEVQNSHVSVGINCIRWAPVSGQGIVYGTNTGALVILR